MFFTEIVSIDITTEKEVFIEYLASYIKNELSLNTKFDYEIKEKKLKNGKQVVSILLTSDAVGTFIIYAEEKQAQKALLHFTSMNIRGVGDNDASFYETDYNHYEYIGDEEYDPAVIFMDILTTIAMEENGTLAYIDTSGIQRIITNGKTIDKNYVALVDENGKVWLDKHKNMSINMLDDTNELQEYSIYITDYITAHKDIAKQSSSKNMHELMDIVGLSAINEKIAGNLSYQEFYDIFIQAGGIGFTDNPQLVFIYNLLTNSRRDLDE